MLMWIPLRPLSEACPEMMVPVWTPLTCRKKREVVLWRVSRDTLIQKSTALLDASPPSALSRTAVHPQQEITSGRTASSTPPWHTYGFSLWAWRHSPGVYPIFRHRASRGVRALFCGRGVPWAVLSVSRERAYSPWSCEYGTSNLIGSWKAGGPASLQSREPTVYVYI